jgi:hypothetical protein
MTVARATRSGSGRAKHPRQCAQRGFAEFVPCLRPGVIADYYRTRRAERCRASATACYVLNVVLVLGLRVIEQQSHGSLTGGGSPVLRLTPIEAVRELQRHLTVAAT